MILHDDTYTDTPDDAAQFEHDRDEDWTDVWADQYDPADEPKWSK